MKLSLEAQPDPTGSVEDEFHHWTAEGPDTCDDAFCTLHVITDHSLPPGGGEAYSKPPPKRHSGLCFNMLFLPVHTCKTQSKSRFTPAVLVRTRNLVRWRTYSQTHRPPGRDSESIGSLPPHSDCSHPVHLCASASIA